MVALKEWVSIGIEFGVPRRSQSSLHRVVCRAHSVPIGREGQYPEKMSRRIFAGFRILKAFPHRLRCPENPGRIYEIRPLPK
ncbi:hypothetical protein TNCV_4099981 [Trichonephila clavipes]|nr:hypothetical protein TNCV_4099981 [Trichonephila clavipes]